MRCGTVVVVMLVASFVSQSEAGWSSFVKAVKKVVKPAVKWVGENCSPGAVPVCLVTVGVSEIQQAAGKRDTGEDESLDRGCDSLGDLSGLDGIPFDAVIGVFEAVDGDEDSVLDNAEFARLSVSLRLIKRCMDNAV